MAMFPNDGNSRPTDARADDASRFSIQFHLLGSVPYDDFLALQRRLVYDVGGYGDGRGVVLLCEHPAFIGVGRNGSRGHIRLTSEQLRARQLEIRWVGRGGGCVLHAPGQIAVYPILPLNWHGWTVGQYMQRLQQAMIHTLDDLHVRSETVGSSFGVWGRSGQLVGCGVAVQNGITCHGAFVNVNPAMSHFAFVDVVPPHDIERHQKSTMGSLFAERQRAVTMPAVRASVIANLAAALGTERYHLTTGHPHLVETGKAHRESRFRAG